MRFSCELRTQISDYFSTQVGPPALMCFLVYVFAGLQSGREAVCCAGFCLASLVASTFCRGLRLSLDSYSVNIC